MTKYSDLRISDHYRVLFELSISVFSLLLLVELLAFVEAPVISYQYMPVVISRFQVNYDLSGVFHLFAAATLALFYKVQEKRTYRPWLLRIQRLVPHETYVQLPIIERWWG